MMEDDFLIWSIEHNAWWRPGMNGYTSSPYLAGRYKKSEAFRISARANLVELNEVPVPSSFMEFQHNFQRDYKSKTY